MISFSLRDKSKPAVLPFCAGWFTVLLTFLIPLKAGSLAVMPEAAGYFPEDIFSWLLINWPAHSFGLFTGTALLLTLAAFKIPDFCNLKGITALLWITAFPLAALTGMINSPASFYAEGQLCHFLGTAAYCAAVWLLISGGEIWKKRLLAALAAGVICLGISGLRQYFFGFEEMRQFVQDQQNNGIHVNSIMLAKVADTRVYAAMVSANVLAGFLLLTVPVTLFLFAGAGRFFEPVKVSVRLFFSAAALLTVPVFLMTKTRAAFLCLLLTAVLFIFSLDFKKIWKILLLTLILLTVCAGTLYIKHAGRGFGSLEERADYMRTAGIMLPKTPVAGYGWGAFFYRHMKEKTTATDESAHDPHNIFVSLILHAGIPAGLLASAALLLPLAVLFRRRRELSPADTAILWGGTAFMLHCCCDINMQIPACLAAAGLLFISAMPGEELKVLKHPAAFKIPLFCLTAAIGVFALLLNHTWLKGEIAYTRFSDLLHAPPDKIPSEEMLVKHYLQVEKLRPRHPFASNIMGDYLTAKNDLLRAEQFYLTSLSRDKGRPAVYMKLSKLYDLLGEKDKSVQFWKKAHELFPTHPKYKLDKQE